MQSQLTNFIVYDIETFSTNRAIPYCVSLYRLSKISRKYNRDLTNEEYQKCKNDTIVYTGTDCINQMLDYIITFKGEPKKVDNKIVEYELHMLGHNGSSFDTYIILNNLPKCRRIVNIIKNGKGIISLKIFNGYIDKKPQYVNFRCGMTHINESLKKIGITYNLQKELLKQEMNHDEIFEDNWEKETDKWMDYGKNDVLCTSFSYARYSKGMEEITEFGMKNSLTLPSLGWKYFNSLRDENDEPIYTYTDKYMRWFIRQSIKGGRCCAFNQYYKSEHNR